MKDSKIDSVLGKNTKYGDTYNPDILVREERSNNREQYGITEKKLPFIGADIWHAYEVSFLTKKGLPVNGVLKLFIPCESRYIVESKSLKLYLFSFNMEKLGVDKQESIKVFETRVKRDLDALLGTDIFLKFFREYQAFNYTTSDLFLAKSQNLESVVNLEAIEFDVLNETPKLLKEGGIQFFFIKSDMLRSNCKITSQPDYGSIYIYISGSQAPTFASLAQYIVSFRKENHFHEEVVECIYSRLWTKFSPSDLMVTALYTRRGGIDICPVRASRQELIPKQLYDVEKLTLKEYRS
jgi:7-cyano-7-deazaguanine reductase